MLSLDWSKVYNRVNFDWLSYVLRKYGFLPNIISVLEWCFYNRTAMVSVDQNEAHIQICQGVPQGDPIALLLYVLALEPMLTTAKTEIAGITNSNGRIHNTAYTDDTSFFLKNMTEVLKLQKLLDLYLTVSGAIINWDKSKLTPLSTYNDHN